MRIGLDLDNTIISYDALFAALAHERELVPLEITGKQAIRDFLRSQGAEERWTELQGIAYGSQIGKAIPFPGVMEFFRRCNQLGTDWRIISHRTRIPYLGEPFDLHQAALQWLVQQGIVLPNQLDRVCLELTRDAKLARIRDMGCNLFVDDLPELLLAPEFPVNIRRILFDPADQNSDRPEYERVRSWFELLPLLEHPTDSFGGLRQRDDD